MTVQLFVLRGVPDDEAEDIRKLLKGHAIDFYETPAGNWGISMPAIWLNNDHELDRARSLIDGYQAQRVATARAEYEQQVRHGKQRTLADEIKQHPLRFVVYFAIAALVLYFSTKPFLDLAR